jgi:hypothetical protein
MELSKLDDVVDEEADMLLMGLLDYLPIDWVG